MGGFDGVWIGEIKINQGNGYPFMSAPGAKFFMMLKIEDGKVSVLTGEKSHQLSLIKAGKFKMIDHKTNAIIYAQNSEGANRNNTGDWVETWNITVTHKDADSIFIYFVRTVNNFLLEPSINTDKERARFFYSYSGELNKATPTK